MIAEIKTGNDRDNKKLLIEAVAVPQSAVDLPVLASGARPMSCPAPGAARCMYSRGQK